MREISKTRKLQVALVIIVCILIFYAVGIATNLFANRVFSMFMIISDESAHNIAAYAAAAGAAAVATIGLTVTLIKKRKTTFPETNKKPAIRKNEPSNETLVRAAPSTNLQAINNKSKKKKTQQKNQDKICPSCKKEFGTPIYMLDYSSSTPKLILKCPYCRQNICSTPKKP